MYGLRGKCNWKLGSLLGQCPNDYIEYVANEYALHKLYFCTYSCQAECSSCDACNGICQYGRTYQYYKRFPYSHLDGALLLQP